MADDNSGNRPGGGAPDPWDGLSLDDDFVKGAAISEKTAKARASEASRRGRGERRRLRAQRRRARAHRLGAFARRYALIWIAVVILGGLVVLGSRGNGPLGPILGVNRPADSATASASTTTTSDPAASSTSTTYVLQGADHAPGTCLIWNQDLGLGSERQVDAVPCAAPHLFEATMQFQFDPGDHDYGPDGPTEQDWAVISSYSCQQDADQFLGYHLDPDGKFFPTLLTPTTQGWRAGDRRVYCGIGGNGARPAGIPFGLPTFTGPVEGTDQTFINGVGVCFGDVFGRWITTDCTGPHITETVGTTEIDAPPGAPYPGDALDDQVRSACEQLAAGVYGRRLDWPVTEGSLGIAESSWNLGRRTVECILARASDGGTWAEVTGPLRG